MIGLRKGNSVSGGWYMIRNKVIRSLIFFAFAAALSGQEVIENQAKPPAKNAGRTLTLKEIVTVRDGGDEFFFEWPRGIQAAPDGSFYLVSQDQLLQFDASGRFLRNYYKKGQGPGEMQYSVSFGFDNRTLIVFSFPRFSASASTAGFSGNTGSIRRPGA